MYDNPWTFEGKVFETEDIKNTMDQAMNSKKKFKSTAKKTSEEKSFRSTLPRDV